MFESVTDSRSWASDFCPVLEFKLSLKIWRQCSSESEDNHSWNHWPFFKDSAL